MGLCIVESRTIEALRKDISVVLCLVLLRVLTFTPEVCECSTEVISLKGGHRLFLFMMCLGQTLKAAIGVLHI